MLPNDLLVWCVLAINTLPIDPSSRYKMNSRIIDIISSHFEQNIASVHLSKLLKTVYFNIIERSEFKSLFDGRKVGCIYQRQNIGSYNF